MSSGICKRLLVGLTSLLLGFSSSGLQAKAQTITPGPNGWTNNTTFSHNWITQYNLSVSSSGHGTVDVFGVDAENYIDKGSNATITPIPNNYFHFYSWNNAPEGKELDNPLEFIADKPYTNIIANFIRNMEPYEIYSINRDETNNNKFVITLPETSIYEKYSLDSCVDLISGVWSNRAEVEDTQGTGSNLNFIIYEGDNTQDFFRARVSKP